MDLYEEVYEDMCKRHEKAYIQNINCLDIGATDIWCSMLHIDILALQSVFTNLFPLTFHLTMSKNWLYKFIKLISILLCNPH